MNKIKSLIKICICKVFGIDKQIALLKSQIKTKENFINQLMQYQIHCQESYPEIFPLVLTKNYLYLLKKYLNDSDFYLEFGSGGSTFLALLDSKTNIFSVESDNNWIEYLSSWKIVKNGVENNKLKFFHIDIGPVGEWGVPLNAEVNDNFYKYSSHIFDVTDVKFDMVLVDGRFRVACVLKTILECDDNIKILVHDYVFRTEYHIIEKFLYVIEKSDSLYVFRKKSNIDKNEVKLCYEKYKNNWQ